MARRPVKISAELTDAFRVLGRLKRTRRRSTPWEHIEQCHLISWVDRQIKQMPALKLLHASFNPGRLPIQMGRKMKREGARPGFPDISLPVPRQGFHGLFIEMKSKTGRLSPDQKVVFALLKEEGNQVVVCRSWEEATKALTEYLGHGASEAHQSPVPEERG